MSAYSHSPTEMSAYSHSPRPLQMSQYHYNGTRHGHGQQHTTQRSLRTMNNQFEHAPKFNRDLHSNEQRSTAGGRLSVEFDEGQSLIPGKLPTLYDIQPIIHVDISCHDLPELGIRSQHMTYDIHRNFLVYHAQKMRPRLNANAVSGLYPPLIIPFPFPSVFGRYAIWLYTQNIHSCVDVNIQHGEWIVLWLLADYLGTPKLQNEIILYLEDARSHDRLEGLPGSFFRKIYDRTFRGSPIRRYLVDTWDEKLQTEDAVAYPPSLLIDLVNARTKQASNPKNDALNPSDYFVQDGSSATVGIPVMQIPSPQVAHAHPMVTSQNASAKLNTPSSDKIQQNKANNDQPILEESTDPSPQKKQKKSPKRKIKVEDEEYEAAEAFPKQGKKGKKKKKQHLEEGVDAHATVPMNEGEKKGSKRGNWNFSSTSWK